MKNILFLLFFAVSLHAQPSWQTELAIPDTSLWAVDLINLPGGGVLMLGRREAHDVLPGIPIEGYRTFGSYLVRLDATGQVVWEQKDLPTGFLTAPDDLNVQGRLPAPAVLIDTVTGTWLLPYTVYAGLLTCADPTAEAFSTQPGLLRGSLATGAVLSDTVYSIEGECGIESIVRTFRQGDTLLAVTQHSTSGPQLLRFDAQGTLTRLPYVNSLFYIQDVAQNPVTGELFAVGDDTLGQLVVLRTDALGMVQQTYVLSNVLFRLQALPDGSGYLGWGFKEVGDSLFFALYRFDTAFAVQWNYLTPNVIASAATAPDGTTFLLEGSFSGLNQFVRVVQLSAQGAPIGAQDYAGEQLYPGSIVTTGDSCFVFTRTTFDLFEHPFPAFVDVTGDCFLTTSTVPDPSGPTLTLAIAPNPAYDRAVVRWKEAAPTDAILEVRNVEGRVVASWQVGGKTGLDLTVSDWPRGVYVVALRSSRWKQIALLIR